jgi:hypothetical protein
LASIDRTAYPRFNHDPRAEELSEIYTPSPGETEFAQAATRGEGSLLSFLVTFKSFQHLGYFTNPRRCQRRLLDETYEHIDLLFGDAIDWKLIETHWKDLVRVVISIRTGKVLPSTLLRKLGNYSRKNRLYRAFREVGRVIRMEFLLRFLSDQRLRQQITVATNKAESYNAFSKWLFFGGDGVLSENDPEEQEKEMKFNELLANSLILQNAADITEVLKALAKEGYEIRREDVAQLSPYLTGHVKRFGDYVIDLDSVPGSLDSEMPALAD